MLNTLISLALLSCRPTFADSTSSAPTPSPPADIKLTGLPLFLGNVTSRNTNDIRDLGYQGLITTTYINTFGDTIPCNGPQSQCAYLEAANTGSFVSPSDTVLTYSDAQVGSNGHAQLFCPHLPEAGENIYWGLGLTNVVETGHNEGIVFFVRNNRSTDGSGSGIVGSGVAHVTVNPRRRGNSMVTCTRPDAQWWGVDEPWFADHGAIAAADGYLYAYGGQTNTFNVWLARVPMAHPKRLAMYEYWNGTAFTKQRLHNATADQAVVVAAQGSIIYSPLYEQYLYFKAGCPGDSCIMLSSSVRPEGPWSLGVSVWGTGDNPQGYAMYAPVVQPKWSSADGRSIMVWYTGFGNHLQAINVTLAGPA